MTLNFSSWILCPSGPTFIGYQYDNLTDVLQVTGTVPRGGPGTSWCNAAQI